MASDNQLERGGGLRPIGETIFRMNQRRAIDSAGSTSSNQDQTPPTTETRTEDCLCEDCGKTFQGEVVTYKRFDPPREIRPRMCPACRQAETERIQEETDKALESERRARRDQWRHETGLPYDHLARTFANFEHDLQKQAYKRVREWAEGFDLDAPRGYPSLMMYSPGPGVGKGHLMAAVVNHVLAAWHGNPERTRCPIRFESGPGLVRRIRNTYNLRKDDDAHEREDEVYRSLAGVTLLLLDDVGKEDPSNFTRETYWYIIDERVKSGLPVIVSSRLDIEGARSLTTLMGEDTVSRLYGMTRGNILRMAGPDYRKLKAVP